MERLKRHLITRIPEQLDYHCNDNDNDDNDKIGNGQWLNDNDACKG